MVPVVVVVTPGFGTLSRAQMRVLVCRGEMIVACVSAMACVRDLCEIILCIAVNLCLESLLAMARQEVVIRRR